jgi:hypothetical protein
MKKKGADIETAKLDQSIADLKHALEFEAKAANDSFYYFGIAKAFEVCLARIICISHNMIRH